MKTIVPVIIAAVLVLQSGCAGKKKPTETDASTSGGETSALEDRKKFSALRQQIVQLAKQEWQYFGKQVIQLNGDEESIPHVGKWEDDGGPYTARVNTYWRSVGKPGLDGMDCKQPWSAAFISWVMDSAGVPHSLFPPDDAHWGYVHYILDHSDSANSGFIGHSITEYKPRPGDLICATRGNRGYTPVYAMDPITVLQGHSKLHCDIVVEHNGNQIGVIGGNVRNSVSKTVMNLSPEGRLQISERRPWFVVLENRL